MDLNYLYHRRGVASYLARHARCDSSREAHRAFARAYTGRIRQLQGEMIGDAA